MGKLDEQRTVGLGGLDARVVGIPVRLRVIVGKTKAHAVRVSLLDNLATPLKLVKEGRRDVVLLPAVVLRLELKFLDEIAMTNWTWMLAAQNFQNRF